jgi:hypothetical protein
VPDRVCLGSPGKVESRSQVSSDLCQLVELYGAHALGLPGKVERATDADEIAQ